MESRDADCVRNRGQPAPNPARRAADKGLVGNVADCDQAALAEVMQNC